MRKKKEEEVNRTCPQHTEKATAPHSSTLTWRIPGTGEPGGLPSMGSNRVRHDWSDLAAAAAAAPNTQEEHRVRVWEWEIGVGGLGVSTLGIVQTVKNLPAMWETQFDSWTGKIPWRRKWQPTSVFLPGEFHGQRRLAGSRSWDCRETDMTERRTLSHSFTELWKIEHLVLPPLLNL